MASEKIIRSGIASGSTQSAKVVKHSLFPAAATARQASITLNENSKSISGLAAQCSLRQLPSLNFRIFVKIS
jgi:hypothetical protein